MEGKTSMLAHFIKMYGTVVCAVYYNSREPIQAFVLVRDMKMVCFYKNHHMAICDSRYMQHHFIE